jgi:Nup133 N terminal like/Non-repetitive/WGA-negative nucleoporin C-terminal
MRTRKYEALCEALVETGNGLSKAKCAFPEFFSDNYTFDPTMFRRDVSSFPHDIYNLILSGGRVGAADGLNMVWASNKERIIFWNYSTSYVEEMSTHGSDVVDVKPITPKAGVFREEIYKCLVVLSESEVRLLCLSRSPFALIPAEMVAILPVEMKCLLERDGRVLMGGVDGEIYEFSYDGENGWFSKRAKVESLTSSFMAYLIPIVYSMGRRSAVRSLCSTRTGVIVLYSDGTLSSYELSGKTLRKIRDVDVSGVGERMDGRGTRLFENVGGGYEACVVSTNGKRIFLNGSGEVVGIRGMPVVKKSRNAVVHESKEHSSYKVDRNLVMIGSCANESSITLISPNSDESAPIPPENFTTCLIGSEKPVCVGISSSDCIGKPPLNSVAEQLFGCEIVLVYRERVETYQIMYGVDFMQRAGANPEHLMFFRYRAGLRISLICALYSVGMGHNSLAVESLFLKNPAEQNHCILHTVCYILFYLWDKDLRAISKSEDAPQFVGEMASAVERLSNLKRFVKKHRRKDTDESAEMLAEVLEMLSYMSIVVDSAESVIEETKARLASMGETLPGISLRSLADEKNKSVKEASLHVLMDIHLRKNSSIDALTTTLNAKCPSFFALNDVLFFKGKEMVERGRAATTVEEREWCFERSMWYFKRISEKNVPEVAELHCAVGNYRGALGIVKHWFYYLERTDILKYLERALCTKEILREALADEREDFCACVLDVAVGRVGSGTMPSSEFLDLDSPFLEEYLENLEEISDEAEKYDLIWKYHLKRKRYKEAYLYLLKIAERRCSRLPLKKRIEYLALASSAYLAASEGRRDEVRGRISLFNPRLGTNARERLEMAQAQSEVLTALGGLYEKKRKMGRALSDFISSAFRRLELELLSYEELFSEYCVPCGFSVLALKIGGKGVIEDRSVLGELWNSALSSSYEEAVCLLRSGAFCESVMDLDVVGDVLVRRRTESKEGENLCSALVSLGFSLVAVLRLLEVKAKGSEYAAPGKKKLILEEAIEFCKAKKQLDFQRRFSDLKSALGL